MDGERPLICIGEALVDLICPDPVDDPAAALSYRAHFGGALANVAVAARRAGAPAALAGACGTDPWGRFLRERLALEGVLLDFHEQVEGLDTPFAFATLDSRREPHFRIHGDGIDEGIARLTDAVPEIARSAAAIVIGSNTLPDLRSRGVTMALVAAARELGVPLLFDPNLRPGRWDDLDAARELCLELATGATLLKCNLGEARWLLGDDSLGTEMAAERLTGLGPELAVVTAGTGPVVCRGACEAAVQPPPVEMVSPLGAGDCFMGTLAAELLAGGWGLADGEEALGRAARAGAEACTRLGAFD